MMTEAIISNSKYFLITNEYNKFTELCEACRKYKYIGVCHGNPGVGKTYSARHYSQWDIIDAMLESRSTELNDINSAAKVFMNHNTIFYTVAVNATPLRISKDIYKLLSYSEEVYNTAKAVNPAIITRPHKIELIVIDEANRLRPMGYEQVRDIYDKTGISVILIGMPGIEKILSRYPQLYSRIGFIHHFKTINKEEIEIIIRKKCADLGLEFNPQNNADREALADITRVTRGNFRLLDRIFQQLDRVMEVNEIRTISKEVIRVARETLVIGVE